MSPDAFFQQPREWSHWKHRLLKRYLAKFAGILGSRHLEFRQQKGRRETPIVLSTGARRFLKKLRARRVDDSPLVFPGRDGQVRAYRNFLRAFDAARKSAGVPGKTIHDLRRTFATSLHNRGVSDELIAAALGQKTTTVVPLYRETRFETLKRVLG